MCQRIRLYIVDDHVSDTSYATGVHTLPEHLDEKVAWLYLDALAVRLTVLSEDQAAHFGIPVDSPFKLDICRY
jgi:adenosylhomocysteinase